MIYYLCTARHADTVGILLSYYGSALSNIMRVLPYRRHDLLAPRAGDVVIWTDFDRLSGEEAATAAELRDRIDRSDPDVLQLNHPTRSLGRFDLLRCLHGSGVNRFNVYRFDEASPDMAFPVFIRQERGNSRRTPVLLKDWSAVQVAMRSERRRGGDVDDLMIVELSAQSGPDGRYRKYGIFRVGDDIFPQDCAVGNHWYIKYSSRRRDKVARKENENYLAANPHAALVRPLFEAAGIEFGRMDYGIVDGRVQVFEINTNPTFVTQPPSRFDDFDRTARARYYQTAFQRLQTTARERAGTDVMASASPEVDRAHAVAMAAVRQQANRRYRRRQVLGFLGALGRPMQRILGGRR